MKTLSFIWILILFSIDRLSAQSTISAKDAAKHIGEKVTVCDRVFRESNKAFAVGLYLGDSTGHYFLVSIRFKRQFRQTVPFGYFNFKGKNICVTGIINKRSYMKVDDPAQIKLDPADKPGN